MNPQLPPVQFAVAFAGAVHGVQETGPQLLTLLSLTQAPLQLWKPELQANPQLVPSQLVDAFATVGHAVHIAPQLAIDVLLTQLPPQRWKPGLQAPWMQTPPVHDADAFANEHTTPQLPQLFTSIALFTSQPFAAPPSQLR